MIDYYTLIQAKGNMISSSKDLTKSVIDLQDELRPIIASEFIPAGTAFGPIKNIQSTSVSYGSGILSQSKSLYWEQGNKGYVVEVDPSDQFSLVQQKASFPWWILLIAGAALMKK